MPYIFLYIKYIEFLLSKRVSTYSGMVKSSQCVEETQKQQLLL